MSLDKAIKSGKEHRKPYRGAKAIDRSCRNHGSCQWCRRNRQHKNDKAISKMEITIENKCARWFAKPVKGAKMVTHTEALLLPVNNNVKHHKDYNRTYYDYDTKHVGANSQTASYKILSN